MNFLKLPFSLFICCLMLVSTQADDQKANSKNQGKLDDKVDARLIPLNESGTVLLDKNGKRILLKSTVVLREGLLEMLCCPSKTKEHESILAVDAEAYIIHAGLLVIGAKPGSPVVYSPEYHPAKGQKINIFLQWVDQDKKLHRVNAQKWIKNAVNRYYVKQFPKKPADLNIPRKSKLSYEERVNELVWYGPMTEQQKDLLLTYSKNSDYQKAIKKFYSDSQLKTMEANWLFSGSNIIKGTESGQPDIYAAQSGDLICVANFPSSMIDLDIRSSAQGEQNLLFEANTENIPTLGTKITIELIPEFKK